MRGSSKARACKSMCSPMCSCDSQATTPPTPTTSSWRSCCTDWARQSRPCRVSRQSPGKRWMQSHGWRILACGSVCETAWLTL
eukprot:6182970-Alexandrium_andersonii.AAC.1